MIKSLGHISDAPAALGSLMTASDGAVLFSFDHLQDYHTRPSTITLYALCHLDRQTGDLHCVVTSDPSISALAGTQPEIGIEQLRAIGGNVDASVINLNRPLPLETVRIPKPWGAEIWYTGIEARGVCRVGRTPLPWILALAGKSIHGPADSQPVLLKILDPLPFPVYGDLYFEMHEQKIEVYVVTNIDATAWPDGTGGIRFGFSPEMQTQFASRDEFMDAYLNKVNEYRKLRVAVDDALDTVRAREGIAPDAVVSPAIMETWKQQLDPELCARERATLAEMHAFTGMEPLAVGDVVRVPNFTPHSLQHGVRVVEFQTPHYERHILSFAQKVLTQDHWDTADAASKINWEATLDRTLRQLAQDEESLVEQVADFDAFEVRRITLSAGAKMTLALDTYALVMVIGGSASVNRLAIDREDAVLVPHCARHVQLAATTGDALILLALAKPSTVRPSR